MPWDCSFSGLSKNAHIIGVVVSEITIETRMATDSVTANSRKSRPTIPPMSRMGVKTAISEMLMESTVNPISLEPFKAASKGDMPSSTYRAIFSTTTMASSTTNPVEIVSAISDRLSRLYPHRYMMPKVPINETGTATPGMNIVRRLRRKTKTTRITSSTATTKVNSTSRIDALMVVV